jgi:hypothetical protein
LVQKHQTRPLAFPDRALAGQSLVRWPGLPEPAYQTRPKLARISGSARTSTELKLEVVGSLELGSLTALSVGEQWRPLGLGRAG